MFLFSQHIPDGWYYCQGLTGKLTNTDNAITYQNNIMLFVCHPKFLHKHCLQFLLGVKMAPRETEKKKIQQGDFLGQLLPLTFFLY